MMATYSKLLPNCILIFLWLFMQTESQVIVKEPLSLLIPPNKIGEFSCEALCNGFLCSGYWFINGTRHNRVNETRMNSTYQSGTKNNILTLTVNASEVMNGTSIQCKYEVDGEMDGYNQSRIGYLFIISSPPISSNPSVSKNATHATLVWSPPFLWPGLRIQQYNISVTNKRDDSSVSHHIVDSSITDSIVSLSVSYGSLQMNSFVCTEIMFTILPVTERTSELMQTFNISDWIWNVTSAQVFTAPRVNSSVLFRADGIPALVEVHTQMPNSNCHYKGLNYTLILENEHGDLIAEVDTFPSLDSGVIKESMAIELERNQNYSMRLQFMTQSQTRTSQKYIFSTYLRLNGKNNSSSNIKILCNTTKDNHATNKSLQVYMTLTGVFTTLTILLLMTLILVIVFLIIHSRIGMIGINLSKSKTKVMVHNPIYEGDGPVYESVLTQHEMNNVHDMNRPRSVVTPGGQHDNFPQSLSDSARYVDRPVHLQYLYSNTTSDTSDTGTPIDTPTSESMPLTAPRVMALKKNGQERNKLHLTLSLGDNDEPSNISSSEMDPNTRTINPADVDEHYIAMSPAGVPSHSMNIK